MVKAAADKTTIGKIIATVEALAARKHDAWAQNAGHLHQKFLTLPAWAKDLWRFQITVLDVVTELWGGEPLPNEAPLAYLRELDAGTDNACWVVCAKNDPGAVAVCRAGLWPCGWAGADGIIREA